MLQRRLWSSSLLFGLGICMALTLPFAPLACSGSPEDDDDTSGDDDTTGDDDASGDDDDATTGDDDDATGDDDDATTGDDDDATGDDDDATGDDDDTTGDDDDATGDDDDDTQQCIVSNDNKSVTVDCCSTAIPSYADARAAVFQKTCLNCHASSLTGGSRNGAPVDVNFDTAFLAAGENNTRFANPPSYYTQVVANGYMPFPHPNNQTLTAEDKQVFYRWELCGHPE